ncbi:uncharacterized protein LOC120628218 [Pararge aegeria]|uniref:Jg19701 protein n=1 Tax=Pararge aegeria aegeria TaxID=348720 RepID=A0A8S4R2B1_9NEOP|nr:uncharacterized protein LOC120628218 [Pararge aegeria]CAH2229563.1 jg19701 [Pararge aegeria aegeria]
MIAIESEQPMPKEERVKVEPTSSQRTLTRSSAVSQKSVDLVVHPENSNNPLHRSKLAPVRSSSESSSSKKMLNLRKTKNSSIESTMSLPNQKSLEKKHGSLRHQKSVGAHSDVTLSTQPAMSDDRKALREALYQGIFHRHRRTIFAVGSFLRMLRSKTSNYDSIRSESDEI